MNRLRNYKNRRREKAGSFKLGTCIDMGNGAQSGRAQGLWVLIGKSSPGKSAVPPAILGGWSATRKSFERRPYGNCLDWRNIAVTLIDLRWGF